MQRVRLPVFIHCSGIYLVDRYADYPSYVQLTPAIKHVYLFLAAKPRVTKTLPRVTYAYDKVTTIIKCPIEGHPKPRIFWGRMGNKRIGPPNLRISDNNLYIANPTNAEAGAYACRGVNVLGSAQTFTRVIKRPYGK